LLEDDAELFGKSVADLAAESIQTIEAREKGFLNRVQKAMAAMYLWLLSVGRAKSPDKTQEAPTDGGE
jgi:hypothetical protein